MTNGRLLVQIGIVAMLGMGGAMAGTSECYAIKNRDARSQCLAAVKGDHSYCYAVKEQDQRSLCLAKTKRQHERCYQVKMAAERQRCLAWSSWPFP